MRYMVIVKANEDSESGRMPSEQELSEMGAFNEELVRAGVMLAGEGLLSSSQGTRLPPIESGIPRAARPTGSSGRRKTGTSVLATRSNPPVPDPFPVSGGSPP